MLKHRVFVTQFESICCAGTSNESLFEAVCTHKSGITIDSSWIKNKHVALGKIEKTVSIETLLTLTCKHILDNSTLKSFSNTLLVVGSSVGGMQQSESLFLKYGNYKHINPVLHNINAIAHRLTQHFTFKDDISFSTACTSSANAIGYGYEMIQKGIYEYVLVVGIDTLSQTTVHGFDALGVLSPTPCRPFDINREGMNVAEGIAVVLLEKTMHKNSIELCGVGYSSDAHHMAQPTPEGKGAYTAMQQALSCANIKTSDVGYINAHGTGTIANDNSEACAIKSLFPHRPFVSSTKSITGHTLGAAGTLEAIICILALQKQIIPPNTHLSHPEETELNYAYTAQKHSLRYVLSNSLAFGGNNTSLVFGLPL